MSKLLFLDNCITGLKEVGMRLDEKSVISLNSHEYLANAFESLPLPAWIKDVDGVMRFLNPAYEKIYDISAAEYIGFKDKDVWPDEIAEKFSELDNLVLEGQSVEYSVEKIPNRVGFRMYDHLHVVKYPIYNGPEVVGIAGIVTGLFP